MAIKPYQNRILGELVSINELSGSGLILGEDKAPQSVRLNVLAIGPDVKHTTVGDVVLVSAFAPTEARESKLDKTVMFSEDDVLGAVTNDSTQPLHNKTSPSKAKN